MPSGPSSAEPELLLPRQKEPRGLWRHRERGFWQKRGLVALDKDPLDGPCSKCPRPFGTNLGRWPRVPARLSLGKETVKSLPLAEMNIISCFVFPPPPVGVKGNRFYYWTYVFLFFIQGAKQMAVHRKPMARLAGLFSHLSQS